MTNPPFVKKSVQVPFGVETSFHIFTERFDRIKPREHNLLATPIAETVFESTPGGRIFDRGIDGSECVWGEVLAVDPPHSLRFAWLIGPDWRVQPKEFASEVEVRFVPVDESSTQVILEHRLIDNHGPGWESVRRGVDSDQGWPQYLTRFAQLIRSENPQ